MEENKDVITIKLDIERKGYKTLKTGVVISEKTFKASTVGIIEMSLQQIKREIEKSGILKNEVKK